MTKCIHCGEDLGFGDDYDLYKSHRFSCKSKVAKDLVNSEDQEMGGYE